MRIFGQIGRVFLIVAGLAVVALVVGLLAGQRVVVLVTAIVALTFGVLGTVFTIVQIRMFGKPSVLRRIETGGLPAIGVIDNVTNTASRVGANPVMRISMTVGVGHVSVLSVVPAQHFSQVMVGSTLPLLTDPGGSDTAMIDWSRLRAT